MSTPRFKYTMSLPCNVTYTANPTLTFRGLIALGPSFDEGEILKQCCYTSALTTYPDDNGEPCLKVAQCPVQECSGRDAAVACVALQRDSWKIDGEFACVQGQQKSSAASSVKGGMRVWGGVVLGLVVGVWGATGV